MIGLTKRGKLGHALKAAIRMCRYQWARILSGGRALTTHRLALKFTVSTRTIRRWIALAVENKLMRLTRTGRSPVWQVSTTAIRDLRERVRVAYARRREGRLSAEARNARFGYREACFAHWVGTGSREVTEKTPHTPYSFEFTPSSSQNQNPPTSLPLVSPPRVGFSRLTSPGVAATTLLLKLAAQASEGCERAAARCVAESGLLTAADGAPLSVSGARRLISRFREQRANGSDCERSATASHLQRDCMNGGRHV